MQSQSMSSHELLLCQHRDRQLSDFTNVSNNVTKYYPASVLTGDLSPWRHLPACGPCHELGTATTWVLSMQCFADRVMKELRRHPPSVMKDPRMPLAMGLWREHLPDLVCLIVYRDPGDNVRSLTSSTKGGAHRVCLLVLCAHLLFSRALVNSNSCG